MSRIGPAKEFPSDTEEFFHLTKNSARCTECNEVLVSVERHAHLVCGCGSLTIFGGLDFVQRYGAYEELSTERRYTKDELLTFVGNMDYNMSVFPDSPYFPAVRKRALNTIVEWYGD